VILDLDRVSNLKKRSFMTLWLRLCQILKMT